LGLLQVYGWFPSAKINITIILKNEQTTHTTRKESKNLREVLNGYIYFIHWQEVFVGRNCT